MRYQVRIGCSESGEEGVIFLNGKETITLNDGSSGGYRLVAETPEGHMIKADFHEDDEEDIAFTRQTWAECRMYPNISKKDRPYFPELIDQGRYWSNLDRKMYSWLIQKKVRLIRTTRAMAHQAKLINHLIEKYGISDVGHVWTGKPIGATANWGVTQRGKPVIYDFGFNQYGVKRGETFRGIFGGIIGCERS